MMTSWVWLDRTGFSAAVVLGQITVVVVLAVLAARLFWRGGSAARHAVWLAALGGVLDAPVLVVLVEHTGLSFGRIEGYAADSSEDRGNGAWVQSPYLPDLAPIVRPLDEGPGQAATTNGASSETRNANRPMPVPMDTPASAEDDKRVSVQTGKSSAKPIDAWRPVLAVLLAAWLAGSVFLLLRLLHGCLALVVLRRSSQPVEGRLREDVLRSVRNALGIESLPPIRSAVRLTGPLAGGVFRPCVLLPDWLPEYLTATQLRDVLVHEIAHLRRRDAWVGLLQRLAEILFWPHPLVCYLNRQLCRVREEMCDNLVLRNGDARAYAQTLLKLAERCAPAGRPFAAIALLSAHWKLEDRVRGLLDTRRNLMTRTNPRLFAAVAAAFLGAGVLLAAIRFGPEAHSQPLAPPSEKEREPASDSETVDLSKVDVSRAVLEGTVVDEAGQPVAGAVVSVLRSGLGEAIEPVRTSRKGTFRLVLAEPSVRYQAVVVRTDGGAKQGIGSLIDVGTPLEGTATVRLVLKPSRNLAVRVLDERGTIVARATVGVFNDEYHLLTSTETDTEGQADLRLPKDAHIFQVVALKPGAGFDYFENYHSWPGRALDTLPARVTLMLDGARTVRVRATDATGKALPGIALRPWTVHKKGKVGYVNFGGDLQHVQARTDKLGIASFEWLPRQLADGAVTFLCSEQNYHLPDAPSFVPSKPEAPLVARLFQNVPIRGKVTLPDGKPAGGILLQAEGRGNTNHYCRQLARTRADGTYSLLVSPDQSYLIAVTDSRWAAPSKTGLIAREGQPLEDIDFALSKGTLIQGTLTVGRDNKPGGEQTITLIQNGSGLPADLKGQWTGEGKEDLVRWAMTDKIGHYSIRVGPGEYEIWGPDNNRRRLTIREEMTRTEDFHIARLPRGPLQGVVLEKALDGKPVSGAIVQGESVDLLGHAGFKAVADERGRFRTERWRDKMILYARNPQGTRAAITTINEEDEEVKAVLNPAGKIRGRILDKDGKSLAGLRVSCSLRVAAPAKPAHTIFFEAATDREGRFTFSGIVPGADCTLYGYKLDESQNLKQVSMKGAETIDLGDLTFAPAKK